ncbi:MAG: Putative RNA methyltransferase Caur_2521 [uncultured Truepera sp.]|uniref:RNA methyltransferase Caur_2521 n=1 Tax=uncultured Truepera sp. TaxID=543023 RepID=A0A6J4VMK3_9DEIN|nr:MAG: Putative RNA methyltransferase Caur_2521 [uncultured Truepera sp.]
MFYTLVLDRSLEPALKSGHPWVYRNHLPKHTLSTGDWVRVRAGSAEAYGLFDAEGQIAVRLFGSAPPQGNWVEKRVQDALDLRARVIGPETDAYRLLYGEGDFLPGITVDRYGRFAVLRRYSPGVDSLVSVVASSVGKALKLRGVASRDDGELRALWGDLPPPELTVRENGIRLLANLYDGQKTGLFLDHRDNRQTLSRFSAGARVLNLFSYTGAFSLYAVRGGAQHVTSVDVAPAAIGDAKRNFVLNGFDPEAHTFLSTDVFALLSDYAARKEQFGVVVLDPPSFARSKRSRFAALRAYTKLNAQALRCTQPGGLLATASCTSQVSPEDFRAVLGEAALSADVRVQVIHEAGHAPDHPVPASFPEGRYLKFLVARVLP